MFFEVFWLDGVQAELCQIQRIITGYSAMKSLIETDILNNYYPISHKMIEIAIKIS